jgi:hypothetical protein
MDGASIDPQDHRCAATMRTGHIWVWQTPAGSVFPLGFIGIEWTAVGEEKLGRGLEEVGAS